VVPVSWWFQSRGTRAGSSIVLVPGGEHFLSRQFDRRRRGIASRRPAQSPAEHARIFFLVARVAARITNRDR